MPIYTSVEYFGCDGIATDNLIIFNYSNASFLYNYYNIYTSVYPWPLYIICNKLYVYTVIDMQAVKIMYSTCVSRYILEELLGNDASSHQCI